MAVDDAYSVVLLHGKGTDTSTTFTDESGKTWTAVGNAQIDTDIPGPWGDVAGTMLFDGTGDYLTCVDSADFDFAGDFSIDFWIRPGHTPTNEMLYDSRPSGTSVYVGPMIFIETTAVVKFYVSGADKIVGTTALLNGYWYHIAITRTGSSTRLYVNGIQEGSTYTDANSYINGASSPVLAGNGNSRGSNTFNGSMKEVRVSKGVARWINSSFIPPVYEYTPTTAQPTYIPDTNVVALLHGDGPDGQVRFPDQTGKVWTPVGTAQVDTAQYKFSPSSILGDGTSDYLTTPISGDFNFGTGDFTIDLWVRFNALPADGASSLICGTGTAAAGGWQWFIRNTTGTYSFELQNYTAGSVLTINVVKNSAGLSNGVWYHFELDRSGTSFYFWQDGVQVGTTATDADTMSNSLTFFYLFSGLGAGVTGLNGWIDEFRVSKGIARHTTTFTPETIPYAGTHVYAELTMTSDTYLSSLAPTTNNNSGNTMFIGESNVAVDIGRTLVLPNFSSIPSAQSFAYAGLVLTSINDLSANQRTMSAHRLLQTVVYNQTTWNVYSTGNNWATAGASHSSTDYDGATVLGKMTQIVSPIANTPVELGLSGSEVQKLYDGTYTNNGIVLFVDTQTSDMEGYATTDHATVAYRPYMRVVYYTSTATVALGVIWF